MPQEGFDAFFSDSRVSCLQASASASAAASSGATLAVRRAGSFWAAGRLLLLLYAVSICAWCSQQHVVGRNCCDAQSPRTAGGWVNCASMTKLHRR